MIEYTAPMRGWADSFGLMRAAAIALTISVAAQSAFADSVHNAVRELQRAINPQRDQSHLARLFALRQLRDPDLQPLLSRIANHEDWQIRVHAILGLAEIDPDSRLDLDRITASSAMVQEAVIANAIDMDLISTAQEMQRFIDAPELAPMPRLFLMGELMLLDRAQPLDHAALMEFAGSEEERAAGLASMLLAQSGDFAPFQAYVERGSALPAPAREARRSWMLEVVRQYELDALLPWAREQLADPDLDDEAAQQAIAIVLQADASAGVALISERLGDAPTLRDRVQFAMLLLANAENVPAHAFAQIDGENELLRAIAAAGRARAQHDDPTEAMIALLDLGQMQTSTWAMRTARELPASQAGRIYRHLIDTVHKFDTAQAERAARAVEAVAKLFASDPDQVLELLQSVPDNSLQQEVLMLGLLQTADPRASAAAKHVKRIGAERADAIALVLLARRGTDLPPADRAILGLIAGGGDSVPIGLRTQAAWLYLKHMNMIDRGLRELFEGP